MIRKGLSGLLTALILGMSVLGPLLAHAAPLEASAIESGHEPMECPPGHDHTVCSQLAPVLPHPPAPIDLATAEEGSCGEAHGRTATPPSRAFIDGHPSRAPPGS